MEVIAGILLLMVATVIGLLALFTVLAYWMISLPFVALTLLALGHPFGALFVLAFWLAGLILTRPVAVLMEGPSRPDADEGEAAANNARKPTAISRKPSVRRSRRRIDRQAWREWSTRYARKKRLESLAKLAVDASDGEVRLRFGRHKSDSKT